MTSAAYGGILFSIKGGPSGRPSSLNPRRRPLRSIRRAGGRETTLRVPVGGWERTRGFAALNCPVSLTEGRAQSATSSVEFASGLIRAQSAPQSRVMENKSYMTVREAANRLAVNPVTVRRMVRRGELQAIQIGRRYRIVLTPVTK